MSHPMLRLNLPFTGQEELEEVGSVLASGYLTQGPKVVEFEKAVQSVVGSRYAFAMSSATTALHLSLVALGIKPGDEVLVSDFTFPASGNVIVQQGARPVLVDSCLGTYAMDPTDLEKRITPKSKAIMVVHPFGLSADMEAINQIAQNYNLPIIEDAACALGANYKGKACGTMGHLGCFSFHPRKSVTTGEGGMIVTNDESLAAKITVLRSHGGVREQFYMRFDEAGFNYRLSDILAAVGVAQMKKLSWLIEGKRTLATMLKSMLSSVHGITLPIEPSGCFHTYQSFVIMLDEAIDRNQIIAAMRRRHVETTLGTYAMHAQPFYQRTYGYSPGDLPNSYHIFKQSLTLPLYPQMMQGDIEQVVVALIDSLQEIA
ncbi:MAG: DegT/DnrJ/EryC1/StrS family aminotransferase [Caldilinea sp. CFX5]|nr:DegT/DnrJ/EryC1/StrS family aminotransferase [Caldilinea sp. CFX5]